MKTRAALPVPTTSMSQISPLLIRGVLVRGLSGTSRVWPGTGWLPAPPPPPTVTLTVRVVVFVRPWLSVTVSVIVLLPLVVYVCVVDTPVPVPPSPKSQAYDATVPGAVSVEPEASTVQVAVGQLVVNDATGATFGFAAWSAARTTVHMVALPEAKRRRGRAARRGAHGRERR